MKIKTQLTLASVIAAGLLASGCSQQMAAQQMESVDNSFMRENDPRMPLLKPDRTTRTSFGKG